MSSVRQRFTDISQNVRNRVRSIFRHDEDNITDQLVASTNSDVDRNQGTGYTELMGGSVPCPSCNGSGMIPKELEGTLVALIPLTDDRLKPKKLWKTVIVWITIFILLGSATIFVLMPRTVNISSLQRPISIVHIIKTDPQDHQLMEFDFLNRVNVSSGNYLPVSIVNVTATIVSKFQPWSVDVIGHGFNSSVSDDTQLSIYGRSTREVYFNNTVNLQGYVAQYCQAEFSNYTALYVTMQFDVSITLKYYYGHQEQVTSSVQQAVCCIPRGNCSSV